MSEGDRVDASHKGRDIPYEGPVTVTLRRETVRGAENPQSIPTNSQVHVKETRSD